MAYAHFAAGPFGETVAAASLATQSNPRFTVPQILHAAALGCLDRREDAKTVVQRLLELQPGITVGAAILSARYTDPKKNSCIGKRVAPGQVARRMTATRRLAAILAADGGR